MADTTTLERVVIDCDPGFDDAYAILMALAHDNIEVVAICCVFGNTSLSHATNNVLRLLRVCGRLDIPVFGGSAKSLLGAECRMDGYFGLDGLGDKPDEGGSGIAVMQEEHASSALIRLSKTYPGQLTLLGLGPLTNLAIALRMDEGFGRRLKRCVIMGGNSRGIGNVTLTAEHNFHNDPEGAYVTLHELQTPITLVPLELCQEHSYSWEWYDELLKVNSPRAHFLLSKEKAVSAKHKATVPEGVFKYLVYDQVAMALVINPKVIQDSRHVFCSVELAGNLTRGQMVVDWNKQSGKPENVTVVTSVDHKLVADMIYKGLEKQ